MANVNETEKKKTRPILWILFGVIIPLIIVIVIISVILGFAGFNVVDWAKEKGSEMPIVSNFIPTEEEVNTALEIERLVGILESRDVEIEQLTIEIENLESEISGFEDQITQQQNTIENYEEREASAGQMDIDSDNRLKDVAKTYEEMKSKNAAVILEAMDANEAFLILNQLPNDVRSAILEAMEVEFAANMTELLMHNNN